MLAAVRRVRERNNVFSLLAHMLGFLSAMALVHLLAIALVVWLHVNVTVIWAVFGVISFLAIFGCLFIMGMARIESNVQNIRQFFSVSKFAFVTTLLMPILVPAVVFLLLVGMDAETSE